MTSTWRRSRLFNDPITVEELYQYLKKGCQLRKIKKQGKKLFNRFYYLDTTSMSLRYQGSTKKFSSADDIKISRLQEVREGEKDFSKELAPHDKSKCFVLVNANHRTIHLMADDQETRDMWIRGLRYAVMKERATEGRNDTDKWIRDAFNTADKNHDGSLDMDEIMSLLKVLNAEIDKKYIKQLFEKADTNKSSRRGKATLDRDEFVRFYYLLTRRPELEDIFLQYSHGKGYMNQSDLTVFFQDAMHKKTVPANYLDALLSLEPQENCKKQKRLSIIGFRNLMVSRREQLFNPNHRIVYQDTNRPLTDYFINSSHNTYLTADQLKGPSSTEAYASALKKGCRCVELDCWDGSDGEPVIYHGHTLTSKILFKDVINAIKAYAFEASPYPVTLSIENHCGIPQQQTMAQHCKAILGDLLYIPSKSLAKCPTLEDLKNKIIIKGKKAPPPSEGEELGEISEEDDDEEGPQQNGQQRASLAAKEDDIDGRPPSQQQQQQQQQQSKKADKKKLKVAPAFSALTGMQSVSFKNLDSGFSSGGPFSVFSLGESKIKKLQNNDIAKQNKLSHNKLLRIYPAGTRTDSSNYNPVPMWNSGCQVVALNFQTPGESMELNHGRFMDNGGIGYVLKPKFLLDENLFGIVSGKMPRPHQKELKIKIISGNQIPKPKGLNKGEIIDPFCKIEIHGISEDYSDGTTQVAQNNGLNPVWNETFTFNIAVPELAIVRFKVEDYDTAQNDFIGYYSLPFMSMQEGYRHFPLYDRYGELYRQCHIFTHVSIRDVTSAAINNK